METTIDAILNRRVVVEQPKKGFRIAVDTILLPACVQARVGEKAIDLGCGAGGAMLALAVRIHGLVVHGLEIQPELVELCRSNILRNTFNDRMEVYQGDVAFLPGNVLFAYDHLIMNPPFHENGKHDPSPDPIKTIANIESHMGQLEIWVISAARCLKASGTMVMIHRSDRLHEILNYMRPYFGETEVIQLLPKEGEASKRVLIRARKGEGAKHVPCRPIIMHRKNGGYTDQVDSYLKHNMPIDFIRT